MNVIACYSNKGGVGKTATSVNLAHVIAQSGYRVLLADLDPQGASSFYFRVKPSRKLVDGALFEDREKLGKAIRASDFENLDILPANQSFREFDIFLSQMKNSRSRLRKALKSVKNDYDVVVLDCPPNISLLSENIFRAADAVLVPVIPTTLSERSFEQLLEFFEQGGLPHDRLHAFFSMGQSVKSLHSDTMATMRQNHGDRILATAVPFTSEVERMGIHRQPVTATAPNSAAAKAYRELFRELAGRNGLSRQNG